MVFSGLFLQGSAPINHSAWRKGKESVSDDVFKEDDWKLSQNDHVDSFFIHWCRSMLASLQICKWAPVTVLVLSWCYSGLMIVFHVLFLNHPSRAPTNREMYHSNLFSFFISRITWCCPSESWPMVGHGAGKSDFFTLSVVKGRVTSVDPF